MIRQQNPPAGQGATEPSGSAAAGRGAPQVHPMSPEAKRRYTPQLPHSYAPPGHRRLSLRAYVKARAYDHAFSCNQRPFRWEALLQRLPGRLHGGNFWEVIPRRRTSLQGISMELCIRLIEFCVRFLEKLATHTALRVQAQPTPEEILADLAALADAHSALPGHEVWMYAKGVEHPVVAAAAYNALCNRWGRARNARAATLPVMDEDPYAEPSRVRVPFPRPEDAGHHQHAKFPPGARWPAPSVEPPFLMRASVPAGRPSSRRVVAPPQAPPALSTNPELEEAKPPVSPARKAARKPGNQVRTLPGSSRFVAAEAARKGDGS